MTTDTYEQYIKKLAKKNEKLTYSDWMRKHGTNPHNLYGTASAEAKTERALAAPTYGAAAESIGALGLSKSGYAKYIEALADRAYKKDITAAQTVQDEAYEQNYADYEKYTKEYESTQEKLYGKVVNEIAAGNMTDYETVLEYAISSGLSSDMAVSASKAGHEAVIQRLRESVITAITDEGYGEYEAYEYAIKLGLNEQIAKELSEYADKVRDMRIKGGYLD